MQKMLVNTPYMQQLIADYFHTQAGKALINSESEIKIEAKETNVAGTQKLFMHSDQNAVINSKGVVDMHGKQGNNQTNSPKNYKYIPVYVDERCLVSFRPKDDWGGEGYGFDWVRVGDTKIPGDVYYGSKIGRYRNGSGALEQVYYGGVFKQDKNDFISLMSNFNPHAYNVKNKKGKKVMVNYCVPWLSIYPQMASKNIKQPNGQIKKMDVKTSYTNTKATLKVIVDIKKKPEKLYLEFDDKLFSITHKPFPLTVGKHELEMTIICLKEFSTDQAIKVIANYKDAKGTEEKSLAGKLKVAKNKDRFKAKVVFIQVSTNIGNGLKKGKPTGRETELKRYLNQALVEPNFEKTVILDVSLDIDPVTKQRHNRKTHFNKIVNPINDPTGGPDKYIYDGTEDKIYTFLNSELYKQYGNQYKNVYKVYFINEKNGHLDTNGNWEGAVAGIGRTMTDKTLKTVLVYEAGFADSTVAHEVFHSMGLYHSFDNDSNFTFEQYVTDNIMDYSDIAVPPIPVISTYHWQWKILQDRSEKE